MIVAGLPAAEAQLARDDAVMTRPREDFDPIGFELFGEPSDPSAPMVLLPRLTLIQGVEDNVYRTENNENGDFYNSVRPSLLLASQGEEFQFGLDGMVDVRRYWTETDNDWEDYEVGVFTGYNPLEDLVIDTRLSWGQFHEDRDDPDSPSGSTNVNEYNRGLARLAIRDRWVDLVGRATFEAWRYDYQDNGRITNDDRDRNQYDITLRGGYEFMPGMIAFVEPSYNFRRYDAEIGRNGQEQDSQGYDVRAGLSYDLSGVTYAEVSAGYFEQDYDDDDLNEASGISFGADVIWNATDLMTVNLTAFRSVEESTLDDVSGVVNSTVSLGIDYEVSDNLLFSSNLTYSNGDFEGSSREDDDYQLALGLVYFVNEFLQTRLKYEHDRRDSTEEGDDFDANMLELSVTLQY